MQGFAIPCILQTIGDGPPWGDFMRICMFWLQEVFHLKLVSNRRPFHFALYWTSISKRFHFLPLLVVESFDTSL